MYSYIVPAISTNNTTQDVFQNSLQQTDNKHSSQQVYGFRQRQDTASQSFVPVFTIHETMPSVNTMKSLQNENLKNSLQNTTTHNSLQNVTHNSSTGSVNTPSFKQYFSTINSQDLLPAIEAPISFSQNANKSHFPLTNTSVLNDNTNIETVSKTFLGQSTQSLHTVLTNQTGSVINTLPSLFKSQYSTEAQRCHTLPLQPKPLNWQTPTIPSEQQEKEPSRSDTMKQPLQTLQVSNYQQMPEILQVTNTPGENKPMRSPWQHIMSTHPWEHQPKPKDAMKQDPATPVGKGQMTYSKFDSPGIDSRFTESLTNLLGSPPPDSPLSKNPFLGDLQALLTRECKREIVPQSLFGMQGSNKENNENKTLNVFERERNLQERFTNLQSSHPEDIRQLSSMFRYQSALIETDRFRTLHECQYPGSYKESVNHHYDNQLHKVMDRVERSVELLENSNKENKLNKGTKLRPHLSKDAVRLMEHWYQQNLNHPYPTNSVIEMLAQAGNIGIEQVKKWFANKRNRSSNTRSLTEIAMQKRKLGQMPGKC